VRLPWLTFCCSCCSHLLQASLLIVAALFVKEGHLPPAAAALAAAKADVLLQLLQASLLIIAALFVKERNLPLVLDEVHVTLANLVAAAVRLDDQLRKLVNKLTLCSAQQQQQQQQEQQEEVFVIHPANPIHCCIPVHLLCAYCIIQCSP
jgi:hypothetical protein